MQQTNRTTKLFIMWVGETMKPEKKNGKSQQRNVAML